MANEKAVVVVKAIQDKLPDNLTILHSGETEVTDKAEMVQAIRGYVRAKVLKQFGISSINRVLVSAAPLGFNPNNVQTALKLPTPLKRLNGDIAETLPKYYARVLPQVQQWFRNCLHNSGVSEEIVSTLD